VGDEVRNLIRNGERNGALNEARHGSNQRVKVRQRYGWSYRQSQR
jgi:hypothetical protein